MLKNDGKPYVFSPYKLVWNTDEYYVVGYSDKHEKLVSFRVDRIDRCPEILDEDAEPRPEKEELMRHIRTMTSMYDSRRERVKQRPLATTRLPWKRRRQQALSFTAGCSATVGKSESRSRKT